MKITHALATAALALASLGAQAATEYVSNGSFESTAQTAGTWNIYNSVTGWTSTNGIEIRNDVVGVAQDGNNFIELDTAGNSTIFQNVAATGKVVLSFWYSARPYTAATNDIGVIFGGFNTALLTGVSNNGSTHNWQHFSQVIDLGSATSTNLVFYAAGTSDGLGGSLDNISVTAVPEPETYAMLLAGLGLMGSIARRRKHNKAA